jgi:hypothetical protein
LGFSVDDLTTWWTWWGCLSVCLSVGLWMLIVLLGHHQRVQEWNVSRKELKELVKMGVLTDTELEDVIAVEFNPVSFCWVWIFYSSLFLVCLS